MQPSIPEVDVYLTLEDFLAAIAEQSRSIARVEGARQLPPESQPELAQRLQQIGQLASQLQDAINQLNNDNADAVDVKESRNT